MSIELGQGHGVFIGLELSRARTVSRAARGEWESLDELEHMEAEGIWSSEFSWLRDGTVCAPMTYFLPSSVETL